MALLIEIAKEAERIIDAAEKDGCIIDGGNVIDLLVDNINLNFSIADLRAALVISKFSGRWPHAECSRYSDLLK